VAWRPISEISVNPRTAMLFCRDVSLFLNKCSLKKLVFLTIKKARFIKKQQQHDNNSCLLPCLFYFYIHLCLRHSSSSSSSSSFLVRQLVANDEVTKCLHFCLYPPGPQLVSGWCCVFPGLPWCYLSTFSAVVPSSFSLWHSSASPFVVIAFHSFWLHGRTNWVVSSDPVS